MAMRVAFWWILTFLICCWGASPSLFGQRVSFGAITGGQITEDFRTLSCPDIGVSQLPPPSGCPALSGGSITVANQSDRFIVGPKVDIRFTPSFSVEVDALRRQIRSQESRTFLFCPPDQLPECTTLVPTTYSFMGTDFTWEIPILAKYRRTGEKANPFLEGGASYRPAENREQLGVTAGAGVELDVVSLRLSPMLRYTHWAHNDRYIGANQDQFQFLVGIDGKESSEPFSAFGHKVSFGVMAGLALTDGFQTRTESYSNTLAIDPATGILTPTDVVATLNSNRTSPVAGINVGVPVYRELSLEIGIIYRPMYAMDIQQFSNGYTSQDRFSVLTWEFPILARYRFRLRGVDPFVETGPSFRISGNLNGANPSRLGVTGGAGIEWHRPSVTLEPTLRFTWRNADSNTNGMATRRNQAELSLNFRF
jgi:hypothetical protein